LLTSDLSAYRTPSENVRPPRAVALRHRGGDAPRPVWVRSSPRWYYTRALGGAPGANGRVASRCCQASSREKLVAGISLRCAGREHVWRSRSPVWISSRVEVGEAVRRRRWGGVNQWQRSPNVASEIGAVVA